MRQEDHNFAQDALDPSLETEMDAAWILDVDLTQIVWANKAALALWHLESFDTLYARDLGPDISTPLLSRLSRYREEPIASGEVFSELWTLYPDRSPAPFRVSFKQHKLRDGRFGLLCIAKAETQSQYALLHGVDALNHIPVCISLFTIEGAPLYANVEARKTYGDRSPMMEDRFVNSEDCASLLITLQNEGRATEICQIRADDAIRWHEVTARMSCESAGGLPAVLLSEVDVTGLKEQEQKITHMAHHDMLTGLHSRNFVNLGFPDLLAQGRDAGDKLAILLIDLDNFKSINDTMGHLAGDTLLIHVASVLGRLIGDNGHIARLGGDEFIILMPYQAIEELDALSKRILEEIAKNYDICGHMINSKASIGLCLSPEHGGDLSTLLRHADLALYEAKDAGRDTYRYFRPDLQKTALVKQKLENDLTRAVKEGEFVLYYQPRVDCLKQTVASVEALIRWNHPEQGIVPPGLFIETLEKTGMINSVGDWLAEQAGTDQRKLAELGFDIPISINISPIQFERPDMVERLKQSLARTQCPAKRIEIEITESMLMGQGYDAKAVLMDLRSAGFSIAVDDFGTGYSNLAYIQQYPISVLKVDRSFVQMIEDRSSVVNMILSLCRLVGVTAVAEGVETMDQLEWLQLNHCNQYQGFLFAKPQPLDQLISLLKEPPKLALGSVLLDENEAEISWA